MLLIQMIKILPIFVVMNTKAYLLITILVLTCAISSMAQDKSIGIINSAAGFGVTGQWVVAEGEEMNNANIWIDTYGMLSGRSKNPGIALSYTRDYIFEYIILEHFDILLHAGAGAMAGYVKDYEKGIFDSSRDFIEEMGMAVGLCGVLGIILDYDRNISLGFNINTIAGIHIRQESYAKNIKLSLYKNGLINSFMPRICLMYRF